MTAKPITGRKVFLITASAFAVVIGVNVVLAVLAVGTFPGLETGNSYVASQRFDAERAAQLELGWNATAELSGDQLRLRITDANGDAVVPATLNATLGRATQVADDRTPEFAFDGTAHVATLPDVGPGNWNLRIVAMAEDGTGFRQRLVLFVRR